MSVTNSIINGNSYEDCGGLYCASSWMYINFSSATPQPIDQANIIIAFTESLGNSFSQTVAYGQFSSPGSVAAGFGAYFSSNYSGLDTAVMGAKAFGNMVVITPGNVAMLSAPRVS